MGDFLSTMRKRQLEDESLEDLLGTAQKQASGEIPYKPTKYARNTSTQQKLADIDSRIANYTYKQYVDSDDYASLLKRYSKQGLKAMDDTIGKVAARTGGIASSYAASAGAQANNAYLTEFENIAREMYDKNLSDMKDERAYLYARDKEQRDNARELALMQMQYDRSDEATRYSRLAGAAETLAKYGDFSGYAELGYTPEQIAKMEKAYDDANNAANANAFQEWALKYYETTGKWPTGWNGEIEPENGPENEPENEPENGEMVQPKTKTEKQNEEKTEYMAATDLVDTLWQSKASLGMDEEEVKSSIADYVLGELMPDYPEEWIDALSSYINNLGTNSTNTSNVSYDRALDKIDDEWSRHISSNSDAANDKSFKEKLFNKIFEEDLKGRFSNDVLNAVRAYINELTR